jgi:hypothetical protein
MTTSTQVIVAYFGRINYASMIANRLYTWTIPASFLDVGAKSVQFGNAISISAIKDKLKRD